MKTAIQSILVGVLIVGVSSDATAYQRGGRGGGGGARGGFSGGGGGGARPAQSMPSPSINRSPAMNYSPPQMSRQAPNPTNRPSTQQTINRPSPSIANQGGRNTNALAPAGNTNRPALGASQLSGGVNSLGASGPRISGSQAAAGNLHTPQNFQRPSQNDLSSFLNMSSNPSASGFSSSGGNPSASQLPSTGAGGNSKSFTTQGGSTITVGGGSGSGTTSGGATVGGAVGGIKVETAGGKTVGKVGGVAGATDGTNSAVRGGSITGATDGRGNSAVNVRGGYADSSGYRQGGSVTAAKNQYGYAAVNARGGYGNGNGTGRIGSTTAVRGPAGNVVSAGRGAAFVNGQFVGGQNWNAVNGNFTHWNYFGPRYVGIYPNAWWPGKWAVATTAWATATYAVASSYCDAPAEGTYYDYGQNVTYEENTVYQDGEPVASAEEYYEQAQQIADTGTAPENQDWMPLGVFAVTTDGQTKSEKVAQLALNKEGIIRGNFHDTLMNQVTPITGAVDKETQRVALRLKGNDDVLVETGLYNLTNDEVPALIHFGANRQEERTLIRLKKPEDAPE